MKKIKKYLSVIVVATGHWLLVTGHSYSAFAPPVQTFALDGLQFGIAAPIATPFPAASINGFVGQSFSHSDNFWMQRFGWRANFALPRGINANARIYGDDLYIRGSVMGSSRSHTQRDFIDFDWDDDFGPVDFNWDGTSGRLLMENRYFGLIGDFHPFGNTWFLGGIRFSAGYYFGRATIDLRATVPNYFPNEYGFAVEIDDRGGMLVFANARMIENTNIGARMNWRFRGPYLGTGFDIGIFRGVKLFTDFGVVLANAPQLLDNNIFIPEDNFQARISVGNRDSDAVWVNINIRDPNASINYLMTETLLAFSGQTLGGVNIAGVPATGVADDVFLWLNGNNVAWIDNIASQNGGDNMFNDLRDAWAGNPVMGDFDLGELSREYINLRADMVRDANDGMRDLRFVPMVRIGLMYRF